MSLLFKSQSLSKYEFVNIKTNKIIIIKGYYYRPSDTFTCYYLGRIFVNTDTPYIGKNWKYIKMVY
jgi:uridine kinase